MRRSRGIAFLGRNITKTALGVRNANVLAKGRKAVQAVRQIASGRSRVAPQPRNLTQVVDRVRAPDRIVNQASQAEALFLVFLGAGEIALSKQDIPDVGVGHRHVKGIAPGLTQVQTFLMKGERTIVIAKPRRNDAQVV